MEEESSYGEGVAWQVESGGGRRGDDEEGNEGGRKRVGIETSEGEREREQVWVCGEPACRCPLTHFFLSHFPSLFLHYFNYKHWIGESSFFADNILPRALNKYFHFLYSFVFITGTKKVLFRGVVFPRQNLATSAAWILPGFFACCFLVFFAGGSELSLLPRALLWPVFRCMTSLTNTHNLFPG